jgi:glycosyltransferase involved in cell wall biosynthesis
MKGHKTIVDAFPRIQEKFPDVKCLFVGSKFVKEKWYEAELRRYVQERKREHAIIFTGDRRDIAELLAVLDVFVLPSLWEGFSTSILEAMAMKKPVVASPVGGVPELVVHQVSGLLIPPEDPDALADAVIWLLSNPDIASKMGQRGYERVQQYFSIKSVVTKTEAVYDQLLEQTA